jgi:mono/diheme cytochrome c family protein
MRATLAFTILALTAALMPYPAGAQESRWPGLYFERCGRCHGDAHALLEKRAELKDGALVGRRSRRNLKSFLGSHFGRRSEDEIATVYMELLRVAGGGGRFRQQCAICHVSAESLARESLVLRNGELFGRYSGRRIADFLVGHGRLSTRDDAAFFVEVLRRNMPAAP